MNKKIKIPKLSLKFIGVVFCAFMISTLVFSILFFNRYRIYFALHKMSLIEDKIEFDIQSLQKRIQDQHISKNDVKKIKKEMHRYKSYSMYLYDSESEIDRGYYVSKLENKSYLATSSFLLFLYEPNEEHFDLHFYDGTYTLFVYSYQGVLFMQMLLLLSCAIAVLLFITIIMYFVHRKMRYVLQIGNEMRMIEGGNLHHTIVYKGNDEITDLARQLNHLRNVLYENMVKEEEARKANEELVAAMSHDLRTPLTSLIGYLDILDMKIYKNDADRDSYIEKSKQKAAQIKEMSDKLFDHFLMYAQDNEVQLEVVTSDRIVHLLDIFCDELKERRFKVYNAYEQEDFQILVDCKMLERIFNNLFSNICKYAQKDMVVVSSSLVQNQLVIKVKNKKKKDASKEESTRIGLKSIKKLMKDMGANVMIHDELDEFCVELHFPYRDTK